MLKSAIALRGRTIVPPLACSSRARILEQRTAYATRVCGLSSSKLEVVLTVRPLELSNSVAYIFSLNIKIAQNTMYAGSVLELAKKINGS